MSSTNLLFTYLKPYRRQVILLWLALLATIATQLINPQMIRRFLDAAENGSALTVLFGAAGLFLAIALLEQALGLATTYLSTDVGWLATNQLREDVVRHCLRLDRTFHKAHPPGQLIERIDGDIHDLRNFFSRLALNLLNNLLLMMGVLVLLWWEEWRIGLAVTLIAGAGLVAVDWLRRGAVPHWQRARQATAELYGYLEERLHGTEDIRANGAVAYTMRGLLAQIQQLYAAVLGTRVYNVGGLMAPILVFGLAYVAIFLIGDRMQQQGSMSIGTVYLVIHYLGLLSGPLWEIVNEVRDLQTAGASVGRVQELLQTTSPIEDRGRAHLPGGPLAVSFEQVSVRYDAEREWALQRVTFHLAAGEVLGLLGRTGSGKTTLTRLLLRLLEPTRGAIRLGDDGVPVGDLPLATLRHQVGMVTQEVQLLQASVRDNLTFFDPTVADEKLWAIAQQLGLADWLATLPAGLETLVGAGGQGLSAGQSQLLAFLRIGLQDPGLVILDEPSSRLDPVTERLLDQAIGRLLVGRTGIIIAHRLETVQRVDKIMVLAEGRMVEFGERTTLMGQDGSHFATLLAQEDFSEDRTQVHADERR
ncbi:MAG: ABC transporter ATP-binding protein [Caldilineaceae bacterium]